MASPDQHDTSAGEMPEAGEIKVSPSGDVVIGVPTAVAIVVINPDEEDRG